MMLVTLHVRRLPERRARRRGASYVFFLGTALLVATIGFSALAVMRVKLRAAAAASDRAAARYYAQSAIDAAMLAIASDASWRDNFPHDDWETSQPIGTGSFTYKVVDETHGNLTTDLNGQVRVYGKGVDGDSVWIYSVMVQPPPAGVYPDLIVNGDLETGAAAPWTEDADCDVPIMTGDRAHTGTYGMEVEHRNTADAGPHQSLAATIEQGATYYADLWVRMLDTPDSVWFRLRVDTDSVPVYFVFAQAQVGTTWTHLSGTITPTWPGTYLGATFEVGTTLTNTDFFLDDVSTSMVPTEIGPLAGTWRRETN